MKKFFTKQTAVAAVFIAATIAVLLIPVLKIGECAVILGGAQVGIYGNASLLKWILVDFMGERAVGFYNDIAYVGETKTGLFIWALLSAVPIIALPVAAAIILFVKSRLRALAGIISSAAMEAVLAARLFRAIALKNAAAADSKIAEIAKGDYVIGEHFGVFILIAVVLICTAASIWLLTTDLNSVSIENKVMAAGNKELIAKSKACYEIHGISGVYKGAVLDIKPGESVCFGRGIDCCQVIFPGDCVSVSRKHCLLSCEAIDGEFRIVDYSSGGTYINGRRLEYGIVNALPLNTEFWLGSRENAFCVSKKETE